MATTIALWECDTIMGEKRACTRNPSVKSTPRQHRNMKMRMERARTNSWTWLVRCDITPSPSAESNNPTNLAHPGTTAPSDRITIPKTCGGAMPVSPIRSWGSADVAIGDTYDLRRLVCAIPRTALNESVRLILSGIKEARGMRQGQED